MGQCCSAPAADGFNAGPQQAHIRAGLDSRGHSPDDMVHVLAAVRASPQLQHSRQHRHNHHHVNSSSSSVRQAHKQHHQHGLSAQNNPYGLSPRGLQQLQQLLPAVPLQEGAAAQGQQQQQLPHLHSTPSPWQTAQAALGDLQPAAHHSFDPQTHGARLMQLQSISSASSFNSMRSNSLGPGMAAPALKHAQAKPSDALSPQQVLSVCAAVVQEHAAIRAAGITPLLLASLCLIESGGCPHAKQYKEHLGEDAHGLCQMLLPTAQWLSSSQGFDSYGKNLTVKDLQIPKTCVYLAAAYLSVLSDYDGSSRSEGFVVRAYHAGPKAVDSAAACNYLHKFLKAKHWLTELARAMAVTVAASALAAGVQLPTAAVEPAAEKTAAMCVDGSAKVRLPLSADSRDEPSKDQNSSEADTTGDSGSRSTSWGWSSNISNSNKGSDIACSSKQVLIRRAAANMVSALCCSWSDALQATGAAAQPAAAGAGSILAHMLPSRWGLSSRQQPQGSNAQLGSTHSSASTSADAAATGLVPVAAADLCSAWRALLCISPGVAEAAAAHAAAAAALAPLQKRPETPQAAAASAASARALEHSASTKSKGSSGSGTADVQHITRMAGSSAVPAAPTAATTPAAGTPQQSLESAPCVIHVVGHGETLQQVANVCNVSLLELLAANPDLTSADAVHHNDCIAVPVPAVLPRLYVAQAGDTLHSIARAHDVPLGRLLAKNPELLDPTRLQPGWVVALPGLKGDSQVALPLDLLMHATTLAELQQPVGRVAHGTPCAAEDSSVRGAAAAREQQQQCITQPRQRQSPVASERHPSADSRQPLAALGSGAFLFTVGSSSSSCSQSVNLQQQMRAGGGQQAATGGDRFVSEVHSRRGVSASRSLDVGGGAQWTVGVRAHPMH